MHGEAAVGDDGRIAFLAARVVAVVVDAVRVPGQRAVAEVERVGELVRLAPGVVACAPWSARSPWSSGRAARRAGRSRRTCRRRWSCRACSMVWRMVSTKMSPERPLLGTMSATSAFFTAGSPARRRPMILTRRPAPMRRGIGIGGSTTPLLGWPSGPSSLWRTVSAKKTREPVRRQLGAAREFCRDRRRRRRRRGAPPSDRDRPRRCAPARSRAADPSSPRPSSPSSLLARSRITKKEGPQQRALP